MGRALFLVLAVLCAPTHTFSLARTAPVSRVTAAVASATPMVIMGALARPPFKTATVKKAVSILNEPQPYSRD